MFGRDWELGAAQIVARRLISKGFDGEVHTFTSYEYALDVHPDDGSPPFRGTAKDPNLDIHWNQPQIGQIVRIRFHAKYHEVQFDRNDPTLHRDLPKQANKKEVAAAHTAEADTQWHALLSGAPAGRPVETTPSATAMPEPSPLVALTPMMDMLAGLRVDTMGTLAAITAAKAAGNRAEVDRLKAEYALRQADSGDTVGHVPSDAHEPASNDRIGQLERLANLHASGALTDAEFVAAKAKLLA